MDIDYVDVIYHECVWHPDCVYVRSACHPAHRHALLRNHGSFTIRMAVDEEPHVTPTRTISYVPTRL